MMALGSLRREKSNRLLYLTLLYKYGQHHIKYSYFEFYRLLCLFQSLLGSVRNLVTQQLDLVHAKSIGSVCWFPSFLLSEFDPNLIFILP